MLTSSFFRFVFLTSLQKRVTLTVRNAKEGLAGAVVIGQLNSIIASGVLNRPDRGNLESVASAARITDARTVFDFAA